MCSICLCEYKQTQPFESLGNRKSELQQRFHSLPSTNPCQNMKPYSEHFNYLALAVVDYPSHVALFRKPQTRFTLQTGCSTMLWLCADSAIKVIYGIFKDMWICWQWWVWENCRVLTLTHVHTDTQRTQSVCQSLGATECESNLHLCCGWSHNSYIHLSMTTEQNLSSEIDLLIQLKALKNAKWTLTFDCACLLCQLLVINTETSRGPSWGSRILTIFIWLYSYV